MKVGARRVYDLPQEGEGLRVLVDRLWPRGIRKSDLEYELWEKEIAPTPGLRKWFAHDPERWEGFQQKYCEELESPNVQARLQAIVKAAGRRNITLLYGARDTEHNHAVVLAEAIQRLY